MEPFVHNTQYSILICTLCKYAVLANEVTAHLRNHHRSITAKARSKVAGLVGDIPGIIRSQADLQSFQYPDSTVYGSAWTSGRTTSGRRIGSPYVRGRCGMRSPAVSRRTSAAGRPRRRRRSRGCVWTPSSPSSRNRTSRARRRAR
ncbi:hypothetical protein CCHR01_19649 [Colletotrichum chrysophilum]|uniref:Uncharacterized protein n=1 Tax=Colletotrichum chrysophilum TaxID=1836956 RepID=A0AAD8ZYL8_9PEZI|nr:hypothetical protein CCHR01_19649 [Colletotrichum chrysophilum]